MLPQLATSQLGTIVSLTINTPDLETSLRFYQRIGFHETMRAEFPFPFIQVTDDAILIMLRKHNDPYLALTYYSADAGKIATALEQEGIRFISKPVKTDMLQRYVFQSPDKLTISLVSVPDGFTKPAGKTMLSMNPADYAKPETYTNQVAGMFGELAHPVASLEESVPFWEKIGFSVLSKFTSPYPWAILSDGLGIVGLHQSSHFNYPAITFFAADMRNKIEALKKNGLENYTEQGPSNIVVTTPEQQHVFLFGMGF